jgi:hypothetical protein
MSFDNPQVNPETDGTLIASRIRVWAREAVMTGTSRTVALLTFALCLQAARAHGTQVLIDDFASAVNTIFITNTNVGAFYAGAVTVATDTGLADVFGGSREITVYALNPPPGLCSPEPAPACNPVPPACTLPGGCDPIPSGCFICNLDNVVVGVVPLAGFLEYNSTAGADGRTTILYDGGGSGLQLHVGLYAGIRVTTLNADPAAVPYVLTLTLVDGDGNSASFSETVPLAGGRPQLTFPFARFPGVNPGNLFSIEIEVDPNSNGAADLRLERIETYTDGPAAAPLASRGVLASLATLLLLGGWLTLRRHALDR